MDQSSKTFLSPTWPSWTRQRAVHFYSLGVGPRGHATPPPPPPLLLMLLHTNNIDIGDISRYFRRFELSMYLYHTVRCDSGKIVGLGLEAQGLGFGVGLVLCSYVALWPCESPQGHKACGLSTLVLYNTLFNANVTHTLYLQYPSISVAQFCFLCLHRLICNRTTLSALSIHAYMLLGMHDSDATMDGCVNDWMTRC